MKLKPCPFCGGEAETRYLYCRPYIICSKCHARIPCYNTYPKAAEEWNRREPMDKIVEQLEKYKELECDDIDDDIDEAVEDAEELYDIGRSQGKLEAYLNAIEIVKGANNERN